MGASKKDSAGQLESREYNPAAESTAFEADQSVGRIREIIFGEQMRAYEARFDALEKKVQERAETVLSNLVERMSELEASIRSELKMLTSNLKKTNKANTEALEQSKSELQNALADAVKQLSSEKTDRSALAALLNEMAEKLSGTKE